MSLSDQAVSVVIPAFNAQEFVAQAIHSVLQQTHTSLELVVVDDGSTDNTADIVRSIKDERLRLLSGPNIGLAGARNRGLEHTNGPTIAFLDADDCWDPRKLEFQLQWLVDHPEAIVVGCRMRYISAKGKVLGTCGYVMSDERRRQVAEARLMPFPVSSALFKRQELELVGGFDQELAKYIPGLVEDLDLLSRLSEFGAIMSVPAVLGSYRIHGKAASANYLASQRMGGRFLEQRLMAKRQGRSLSWDEFSARYRPSFRERRQDRAAAAYRAAGLAVAEKRWISAVGYGIVAILANPRYTFRRLTHQRPWSSKAGSLEPTREGSRDPQL